MTTLALCIYMGGISRLFWMKVRYRIWVLLHTFHSQSRSKIKQDKVLVSEEDVKYGLPPTTAWYMTVLGLPILHGYQGQYVSRVTISLQWRLNGRDSVSNHQPHDCLFNRLFRRRSKKKSKLRVTGLCEGNSPGTGEFPAQRASNTENVSIWWRHHDLNTPCRQLRKHCCNSADDSFEISMIQHRCEERFPADSYILCSNV